MLNMHGSRFDKRIMFIHTCIAKSLRLQFSQLGGIVVVDGAGRGGAWPAILNDDAWLQPAAIYHVRSFISLHCICTCSRARSVPYGRSILVSLSYHHASHVPSGRPHEDGDSNFHPTT